jgi:hypothetical protein
MALMPARKSRYPALGAERSGRAIVECPQMPDKEALQDNRDWLSGPRLPG